MNGNWPSNMEFLFHWTSALGYLNSSINFVIYSAINKVIFTFNKLFVIVKV